MLRPPVPSPAGAFSPLSVSGRWLRFVDCERNGRAHLRRAPATIRNDWGDLRRRAGSLRRPYVFTVAALDFRGQTLPNRRTGVIPGLTQVFRGFQGPFLGGAAKSDAADAGVDADRLVEIGVHVVLVATLMLG